MDAGTAATAAGEAKGLVDAQVTLAEDERDLAEAEADKAAESAEKCQSSQASAESWVDHSKNNA